MFLLLLIYLTIFRLKGHVRFLLVILLFILLKVNVTICLILLSLLTCNASSDIISFTSFHLAYLRFDRFQLRMDDIRKLLAEYKQLPFD